MHSSANLVTYSHLRGTGRPLLTKALHFALSTGGFAQSQQILVNEWDMMRAEFHAPKANSVQYKLRLGDDSPWQASEVPLSNAQLVSVADPETVCLSYASGRRQAECNRGRQHLRLRSTYLRGGTHQTQGRPVALPSWNTHSCRTFSCTQACLRSLALLHGGYMHISVCTFKVF